jgi:hypothetical protein
MFLPIILIRYTNRKSLSKCLSFFKHIMGKHYHLVLTVLTDTYYKFCYKLEVTELLKLSSDLN